MAEKWRPCNKCAHRDGYWGCVCRTHHGTRCGKMVLPPPCIDFRSKEPTND